MTKLELKGDSLQNKMEAKKQAKLYLEEAEKLGDKEASCLLGAMKFLDNNFPALTDYKETIETNSDPFKALRDRVTEIKCKGLGQNAKKETLERFMNGMLKKYKLEISDDEKKAILEQTENTISIRNAKTIIEGKILSKRINLPTKNKEKKPLPSKEKINLPIRNKEKETPSSNSLQESASNDTQSRSNVAPSPMQIEGCRKELVDQNLPNLEMDKDLQKDISSLCKIAEELSSFGSASEEEQINAISNLFGGAKYLSFIPKSPIIESLYKTERWRGSEEESVANGTAINNPVVNINALGALKNRMNRFDTDQKRAKVFIYHLELVRSIATKLLKLEKTEQPYKKIIPNNDQQKERILSFCYHLEVLKQQAQTILEKPLIDTESRHYISCQNTYNEFVSWFTNKGKTITCSDVIKSHFKLLEK